MSRLKTNIRTSPRYAGAFEAARARFQELASPVWRRLDWNPEEVLHEVIEAYLRAHNQIEIGRFGSRIVAISVRLSQMSVNDVIEEPEQCRQALYGRMRTARSLMDNPHAIWTVATLPNGRVSLTRLEDGARYKRPANSPITLELANMTVGQTIVSKAAKHPQQLGSNHKVMARRVLQDANAQWTSKLTSKGLRIMRVE